MLLKLDDTPLTIPNKVAIFLLDPKNKTAEMDPIDKCLLVNEKLGVTNSSEDYEKFEDFVKG